MKSIFEDTIRVNEVNSGQFNRGKKNFQRKKYSIETEKMLKKCSQEN